MSEFGRSHSHAVDRYLLNTNTADATEGPEEGPDSTFETEAEAAHGTAAAAAGGAAGGAAGYYADARTATATVDPAKTANPATGEAYGPFQYEAILENRPEQLPECPEA